MRFDVEQVVGSFAQVRILEGLERSNRAANGGAPRVAGALPRGDQRVSLLVYLRIVEKLEMRADDRSI
jgi:hypothetical protein